MKLDTKALRYLTPTDWRVLIAVETGSRNHEVVPTPLIAQLSGGGSRNTNAGDVQRSISTLAKADLVARVKNAKYDGYRLTYGGLDYLALHTFQKQGVVYSVGNQIGIGKESDIFVVADDRGTQRVLKIHRLGRVSFKKGVRRGREYGKQARGGRGRQSGSWMDMSRLAATKEVAFMKALGSVPNKGGLLVPEVLGQNRHQIVMELIDGVPLRQVDEVGEGHVGELYGKLMKMILRLAEWGLIHGDFNEFNIMIKEVGEDGDDKKDQLELVPVLIDFPQMVSVDHLNAEFYFNRDVQCVKRFFERRFKFVSDEAGPFWGDAKKSVGKDGRRLDVEVEASGFSRKMAKQLEAYMQEYGVDGDARGPGDEDEEEEEEEEEDARSGGESEESDEEEEQQEEVEPVADTVDGNGRDKDDVGDLTPK